VGHFNKENPYIKVKEYDRMSGKMKKESIIMHPFPRVNELPMSVDSNLRASYLTHQMRNGLYIRMALLSLVLKK